MYEQLLRYFSGESTVNERLELIHRVENDDRLKAEFIRIQNLAAVSKLSPHTVDRDEGVRHFKIFTARVKQNTQRKLFINFTKYAALALVLIASTVFTMLYLLDTPMESSINTLHVPAGQRARLTLQDGTEVWLNAQSTLKYPAKFSRKNRRVEVEGEAFFKVSENKRKPFIVSTQYIEIGVLGTEFNVQCYPDTKHVQTALVEGSVRIYMKEDNKNLVLLKPNEQMTYSDNIITVSSIVNPDHLLWINGIYSFSNERLIDIIKKLELYYDISIIVEDPQIFDVRYTGKFRQSDGIDEILRILQKIQPFNIKRDRDKNRVTLSI